jgi:hypothetical protein
MTRTVALPYLLILLLAFGGAACDGGTPAASSDDESVAPVDRYVEGSLQARIEAMQDAMPRRGSEGFEPPTRTELDRWRTVAEALVDGDTTAVDAQLAEHFPSYALVRFTEEATGRRYYLVQETPSVETGWGSVVVRPDPERNLAIHAPHPVFDLDTHREGVDVFQQTGARMLLLAGTHRCANQAVSPCDGTSSVCGDGRYHVSDMAHVVMAPFQATHAVFAERFPEMVSISLHGNGNEDCETVFLSSGVASEEPPSVQALQQALAQRGVRVGVPSSSSCPLVGSTNVQGRLLNGAAEPCTEAATQAGGTFIHVEQRRAFRADPDAYGALIEAIKATF